MAQQCKVCSKTLVSTIELLQHIAKEHSSNEETNTNRTESQDPEKIKENKNVEGKYTHNESQIYCELCSISCKNKKALEKHMNSSHEGHKSCEVCGKKLLSAEALKNHAKNSHNESRFVFSESMLDEFL